MKKLLIITTIGGLLCSYMINARMYFLDYAKYLKIIDFWVAMLITYVLLAVYMLWITLMYYLCFIHKEETGDSSNGKIRGRHGRYVLSATAPVIVLHLSMLHIVLRQQHYTLFDSGYLLYDFSFFLVPVVAYTIMVYYRPEWSIFYRVIEKWVGRLIRFVLERYRPKHREEVVVVLPSAASAGEKETGPKIPEPFRRGVLLGKLLFLEFKTRQAVFYTVAGERIVVPYTSSIIKDWPVGDWFVQIRKGFYINMWHIGHGSRSKYKLLLNPELQEHFMEERQIGVAELEGMLHVSKDLRKNIAHHFNIRDQLPNNGWEEMVFY